MILTADGATFIEVYVSAVTDMSQLFHQSSDFNDDIGDWDTSKVTDMDRIFG